jgi:hypothetical protein
VEGGLIPVFTPAFSAKPVPVAVTLKLSLMIVVTALAKYEVATNDEKIRVAISLQTIGLVQLTKLIAALLWAVLPRSSETQTISSEQSYARFVFHSLAGDRPCLDRRSGRSRHWAWWFEKSLVFG